MNWAIIGGRRFVLALGAGVVTSVLQWFGKLDPAGAAYGAVILGTVAAFITGNVAESRNDAIFNAKQAAADPGKP